MNIVMKKTSELIPYARNNKIHSESQIKKVAASIQEFGFTQPIVIDSKNSIVIGHCRVKSAELLGMEEVPCFIADDLTKAQISALRITDNKMSELAEWDNEMLGLELQELQELDFDISLTGFDESELEDILGLSIDDIDTKDKFSLPDGDKEPFQQMTFTLADDQSELIKEAIRKAKNDMRGIETFGNENSNGNALYKMVMEWEEQKR